ncbi:hypothetical protein H0H92_002214 [Tricholoma furcatifolium]|nr:hypothetical protein H0H92_002214 [Tricholoma furcatifolium]
MTLDSVDGEISFFRSLTRARPIGIHRHFNIIAIRNAIYRDTNQQVNIDDLWHKLSHCYNLDALEAIDLEADAYESSPTVFQLPYDEYIDSLIAERRVRTSPSPPSSPIPTPAPPPPRAGRKRGRTKLSMAGLVGGESDSSALTQESGDEADADPDAGPGSPRASSVVTGTDPGTDHVDDDDVDMPEPSTAPASTRGRGKYTKKGAGARGRGGTRAGAAESTSAVGRPPKKRKR